MAELTDKQVAIGNGAAMPDDRIHVACHQCDDCGHIGINDEAAPEDGKCRHCGWRGLYPQDDKCPSCGWDSCIESVCPQCGGLYVLLVEDHIAPGVLASPIAPIAAVHVQRGDVVSAHLLAPGLPDGWHDLYPDGNAGVPVCRQQEEPGNTPMGDRR